VKSREARRREAVNLIVWEIGALAVLLFCLVIIDSTLVEWLNTNSGAVMAIVTTVYALFTILLWLATKQQAEITRLTFEASHRPYVTMKAEEPGRQWMPVGQASGRLSFNVVFENHGSVPAAITAWEVRGTLMDLDRHEQPVERMDPIESPVGRYLAPHTSTAIVAHFVGGDLPNPVLPFRVYARVEYRGLGTFMYVTDFNAERAGEGKWTAQGYTMT
jgi:hypothetical protein